MLVKRDEHHDGDARGHPQQLQAQLQQVRVGLRRGRVGMRVARAQLGNLDKEKASITQS